MTQERARQTVTDAFPTDQSTNGVRLMGCYWLVTAVSTV